MHGRPTIPTIALAVAFSFAASGLAGTPGTGEVEGGEDWRVEQEMFEADLEGITAVHLVNHYGDLYVRAGSAGVVEGSSATQRHVDDPRLPELVRTSRDGIWSLEVSYPKEDATRAPDAWRKRRIDLVVFVPPEIALRVETLHGGLRVKNVVGGIEARSESGPIRVETSGEIDATCSHGSIDVLLKSRSWGTAPQLRTVSGEIRLRLPWLAEPRAILETRGRLASDYSLTVEWPSESLRKRGTVGEALEEDTSVIRMSSERGDLALLRTVKKAEAKEE